MCDSWRMKSGAEMDAYAAYSAFRQLGKLDVVRITGGEPFLREDLGELARSVWLASRPAVLHLTTNGSFPDRAVAAAQVDQEHDHGANGSYTRRRQQDRLGRRD